MFDFDRRADGSRSIALQSIEPSTTPQTIFARNQAASAAFTAVDVGWLSPNKEIAMNDNEATRSGKHMSLAGAVQGTIVRNGTIR